MQLQGNIADLVEEERAAVRQLESADPLGDRTGEGALLVSEELAFQQAGGNRGAIQLDKRTAAAALRRYRQLPSHSLLSSIVDDVRRFSAPEQFDDSH